MNRRRRALIIANLLFDSDDFPTLRTPGNNALELARVLSQLGEFEVWGPLVDKSSSEIKQAIATIFEEAKFGDTILLYYSGHGETDDFGRYYLITRDSRKKILDATAVDARFIHERMKGSRSKSLIVVLDSCYSASFIEGALSESTRMTLNQFSGRGRVILTSSGPTQLSFEEKDEHNSIFTSFLLKGLETGAADVDQDGYVSAEEWFDYVEQETRAIHPGQDPLASFNLQKGNICVARIRDDVPSICTLQSSPSHVSPTLVAKPTTKPTPKIDFRLIIMIFIIVLVLSLSVYWAYTQKRQIGLQGNRLTQTVTETPSVNTVISVTSTTSLPVSQTPLSSPSPFYLSSTPTIASSQDSSYWIHETDFPAGGITVELIDFFYIRDTVIVNFKFVNPTDSFKTSMTRADPLLQGPGWLMHSVLSINEVEYRPTWASPMSNYEEALYAKDDMLPNERVYSLRFSIPAKKEGDFAATLTIPMVREPFKNLEFREVMPIQDATSIIVNTNYRDLMCRLKKVTRNEEQIRFQFAFEAGENFGSIISNYTAIPTVEEKSYKIEDALIVTEDALEILVVSLDGAVSATDFPDYLYLLPGDTFDFYVDFDVSDVSGEIGSVYLPNVYPFDNIILP